MDGIYMERTFILAVAQTLEPTSSFTVIDEISATSDDGWLPPEPIFRLQRAVSLGNKQYGFTSLGRGFNWLKKEEEERNAIREQQKHSRGHSRSRNDVQQEPQCSPFVFVAEPEEEPCLQVELPHTVIVDRPQPPPLTIIHPPAPFRSHSSPRTGTNESHGKLDLDATSTHTPASPVSSRTGPSSPPTMPPRPPSRRHSSQKRVSLVAGRLKVIDDPTEIFNADLTPHILGRQSSQSSILSVVSTRAPSPNAENFLGTHTINDFVIEGEAGRGAYGLVKRAREKLPNGDLGPPLIIKQVIKSRILADCWKKHPKLGTIPIEIYVMSSISNATYVLPPRRPWDPSRPGILHDGPITSNWVEGFMMKGHPNICPLLDFFEDAHFYYLLMPATSSIPKSFDAEPPPADLFDLVELYPNGLPSHLVRSYLGQIADAMCFLHAKGIVHRDIKDENVVLGPSDGQCFLIDFGSSGIVRRGGWDTFSGTLDYAGPEILRGESYNGKEQDVWAFGVVAYVLLVGECPFQTPMEAQEGLSSPFAKARMALDERCTEGHEDEGEESDGGGRLEDAHRLVMACLQVGVMERPTFDKILNCRFLSGRDGW
ncbi:hypothetical protein Clacol_003864 [Clathrus columnatus]|uniref:Protein kinase domain-containing protein n=1 Tax=Clathrus columnatus TaxID=1419009 RepID=A0AAV5ACI4_9AGAM|nr:hypothetical protein Clacol_003864 [Clathrus columnatus]